MSTYLRLKPFIHVKLKLNHLVAFACIAIFMSACSSEDVVATDPELEPYFQIFADEGLKRGVIVDYEVARIEGLLHDIPDTYVQGQCYHNEKKPKKVVIDLSYWDNANEAEKEFIVAHELGHCFLLREHLDDSHPDGTCVSIMHSSPSACDFILTDENRKEYYNELFLY